jgi:hypothetical protein
MTDDVDGAGFVVGSAAIAWNSSTLQWKTKQVNKEIKLP